jgi:hypothetical protein
MRRETPEKIDLSDHEMLVGDFRHPSIAPKGAWDAAVQARAIALSGFHLVRAVRPDMDAHPVEVVSQRKDVAELAGRLTEAAVEFEMAALLTEITAKLRGE